MLNTWIPAPFRETVGTEVGVTVGDDGAVGTGEAVAVGVGDGVGVAVGELFSIQFSLAVASKAFFFFALWICRLTLIRSLDRILPLNCLCNVEIN